MDKQTFLQQKIEDAKWDIKYHEKKLGASHYLLKLYQNELEALSDE